MTIFSEFLNPIISTYSILIVDSYSDVWHFFSTWNTASTKALEQVSKTVGPMTDVVDPNKEDYS